MLRASQALTHFHISPNVAALPCISRPVRKIRPAAYTAVTDVAAASTTETATCHIGGPGGRMMRSSMRNRALVGNIDSATQIGLSGAFRISHQGIHGHIIVSI